MEVKFKSDMKIFLILNFVKKKKKKCFSLHLSIGRRWKKSVSDHAHLWQLCSFVFSVFSLLINQLSYAQKMQCLSYTPFSCQLLHLRFKRGKLKQQDVMQPIHKENRTASILQYCTLLTHCGEPCATDLDSQQQRPSNNLQWIIEPV